MPHTTPAETNDSTSRFRSKRPSSQTTPSRFESKLNEHVMHPCISAYYLCYHQLNFFSVLIFYNSIPPRISRQHELSKTVYMYSVCCVVSEK